MADDQFILAVIPRCFVPGSILGRAVYRLKEMCEEKKAVKTNSTTMTATIGYSAYLRRLV